MPRQTQAGPAPIKHTQPLRDTGSTACPKDGAIRNLLIAKLSRSRSAAQEFHALERHRIRRLLDIAPDTNRRAQCSLKSKALNRQPAVVPDILQAPKHALPLHMAASRNTAIVLARMQMLQMLPQLPHGLAQILLFNI